MRRIGLLQEIDDDLAAELYRFVIAADVDEAKVLVRAGIVLQGIAIDRHG